MSERRPRVTCALPCSSADGLPRQLGLPLTRRLCVAVALVTRTPHPAGDVH